MQLDLPYLTFNWLKTTTFVRIIALENKLLVHLRDVIHSSDTLSLERE